MGTVAVDVRYGHDAMLRAAVDLLRAVPAVADARVEPVRTGRALVTLRLRHPTVVALDLAGVFGPAAVGGTTAASGLVLDLAVPVGATDPGGPDDDGVPEAGLRRGKADEPPSGAVGDPAGRAPVGVRAVARTMDHRVVGSSDGTHRWSSAAGWNDEAVTGGSGATPEDGGPADGCVSGVAAPPVRESSRGRDVGAGDRTPRVAAGSAAADRDATDARARLAVHDAVFATSPIAQAIVSPGGDVLRASDRFATLLGVDVATVTGLPVAALLHTDDRFAEEATRSVAVAGATASYRLACRVLHRDGRVAATSMDVSVARDETGRAVALGLVLTTHG